MDSTYTHDAECHSLKLGQVINLSQGLLNKALNSWLLKEIRLRTPQIR